MPRKKKDPELEIKVSRRVKILRELLAATGTPADSWSPAIISDNLKMINYIRSLVDTWNPAQLNEAIRCLGFKTVDSWNPAVLEEQKMNILRLFTPKTATGNPVEITIGGKLPVEVTSTIVTFSPKQSGTGDPSPTNIRPISGWDGLTLTRTGKNLLYYMRNRAVNGITFTYDQENGSVTISGQATNNALEDTSASYSNYPLLSGSFKITGAISSTYGMLQCLIYDMSGNQVGDTINISDNTTITANNNYVMLRYYINSGADLRNNPIVVYPMIRESDITDDTFEPYNKVTYTAAFESSIPGGSYDFVSGNGESIYEIVDMGDLNWGYSNGVFNVTIDDKALNYNMLCSCYKPTEKSRGDLENGELGVYSTGTLNRIAIRDDNYTTAADFKVAVTGQTLVYELATPTEITLTPADVNLLKGSNTVWTDGDNIILKYQTKL